MPHFVFALLPAGLLKLCTLSAFSCLLDSCSMMRHALEFHTRLSSYDLQQTDSSDCLTLADSLPIDLLIHQNVALYLQASLQRYRLQQINKALYFLPFLEASLHSKFYGSTANVKFDRHILIQCSRSGCYGRYLKILAG